MLKYGKYIDILLLKYEKYVDILFLKYGKYVDIFFLTSVKYVDILLLTDVKYLDFLLFASIKNVFFLLLNVKFIANFVNNSCEIFRHRLVINCWKIFCNFVVNRCEVCRKSLSGLSYYRCRKCSECCFCEGCYISAFGHRRRHTFDRIIEPGNIWL